MKRPYYFYQQHEDDPEPTMLYAVYADDQLFYVNGPLGWIASDWGSDVLAYMHRQPQLHPCSLADVRAFFDIKAHKRTN